MSAIIPYQQFHQPIEGSPPTQFFGDGTRDARFAEFGALLAGSDQRPVAYDILGLRSQTGFDFDFGAGGIGKTGGKISQCLSLVGDDGKILDWMGLPLGDRRGVIVYYTAEDELPVFNSIATDVLVHDFEHLTPKEKAHRFSRLLPICPVSMTREEFPENRLSLFRFDRALGDWTPTSVFDSLFHTIDSWNASHGRDDQVIGLVIDSWTTVAGGTADDPHLSSVAPVELNRCAIERGIWINAIGHTQKDPKIDRFDPDANAEQRFRGSANLNTSVRQTNEWREGLGPAFDGKGKEEDWYETKQLVDLGLASPSDTVVGLAVAKGNALDKFKGKLWMKRLPRGGYVNLNPDNIEIARSRSEYMRGTKGLSSGNDSVSSSMAKVREDVSTMVLAGAMALNDLGKKITANSVQSLLDGKIEERSGFPAAYADLLKKGHHEGGLKRNTGERPAGSSAWHLDQLVGAGILCADGNSYTVLGDENDGGEDA